MTQTTETPTPATTPTAAPTTAGPASDGTAPAARRPDQREGRPGRRRAAGRGGERGDARTGEQSGAQSGAQSGDRAVVTPADLTALLAGRWGWVREEARATLPAGIFTTDPSAPLDVYRDEVMGLVRELAATGSPAHGFPREVGGGGDVGASVVQFEMLGYGDLSVMIKSGVHFGLFGGAVQSLGSAEHHRRWLPATIALETVGCFAMTETGHGSDVANLETTAVYDAATQEFVLTTPHDGARKDYIGGAARHARVASVFAQLVTGGPGEEPRGRGVHCVVVPLRDADGALLPGVEVEDDGVKAGLNGVDNGRIRFTGVRVPREDLLDRFAQVAPDGSYASSIESPGRRFFTTLGALVRGRVCIAAGAGAATQQALAVAVRYGLTRRQFTRPGADGAQEEVVLLDYRAHQRRLMPALATSYVLQLAQNELTARLHDLQSAPEGSVTDDDQRELENRAAGLKAVATWHATSTIQTCREACGGAGYLAANRLPQLKADTDVFTTFEGDNTVLLQLVGKGLLTGYAEDFGELGTWGTVRAVADQVRSRVMERTTARVTVQRLLEAAPGRDEDADLRDRGWQMRLLVEREAHLLVGVARRLRRAKAPGADAAAVFDDAQDHLLAAARAHVDRVVVEALVAAEEECEDDATAELLARVGDLHVLSLVERDRAWYLEHGWLTPGRSKAVLAAVNELCREVRADARLLVDGFGIPEAWITAPIAHGAVPQPTPVPGTGRTTTSTAGAAPVEDAAAVAAVPVQAG
ncbi:acyl-CoA dehydrogenase [uncultured Pseudokineococcus sp.]|uniref:acyl-CoA dehydrogenase family protein n=1 Tax=uncultured Pseudokineococcus sp. TaxID=1642928 RepID=UPI002615F2E9|nr:acyl-CoA dehydrogenase [uncultured Pseudokineococcus sp.]